MGGELSKARKEMLERHAGPCVREQSESMVSVNGQATFTYEDIAAFQDAYYGGEGERYVHMSDIPGKLCFRSMGERENRFLADQIAATCKKDVLTGNGNSEKCEAFHAAVEDHAGESTSIFSWANVKWATKWLIGSTLVGATFHGGGKLLDKVLKGVRYARTAATAARAAQVAASATAVGETATVGAAEAAGLAGRTAQTAGRVAAFGGFRGLVSRLVRGGASAALAFTPPVVNEMIDAHMTAAQCNGNYEDEKCNAYRQSLRRYEESLPYGDRPGEL